MRLVALSLAVLGLLPLVCGDGSPVRARIDQIVDREKKKAAEKALKAALDAEFELADQDEDGVLSRDEFGIYLQREDGFKATEKVTQAGTKTAANKLTNKVTNGPTKTSKREGQWLGRNQETQEPLKAEPVGEKGANGIPNQAGSQVFVPGTAPTGDTGFFSAFSSAFVMILVTEIMDKTFFIAMIMALKHSRIFVYSGAVGALVVMTILSTIIGAALPAVLPREWTTLLGAVLFFYFGAKMLIEAREHYLSPPEKNEELEEAEEEVNSYSKKNDEGLPNSNSPRKRVREMQLQILMQAFTLTFLAEWGDRSQIATVTLAATKNPYGITLGGCIGHALCTGLAVLGGQFLSNAVSEKEILLTGGVVFILFGLHSLIAGPG